MFLKGNKIGNRFQKGHKTNIGKRWKIKDTSKMKAVRNRPDTKKRMIEASLRRWSNPEEIRKQKQRMKEVANRIEVRKKNSKARKKNWKDKDFIRKRKEAFERKEVNWKGGPEKSKQRAKQKQLVSQENLAGRLKSEQCEICGAFDRICFDHNHETGKFRGWICMRCNIGLGMARDKVEILHLWIKYLEKK